LIREGFCGNAHDCRTRGHISYHDRTGSHDGSVLDLDGLQKLRARSHQNLVSDNNSTGKVRAGIHHVERPDLSVVSYRHIEVEIVEFANLDVAGQGDPGRDDISATELDPVRVDTDARVDEVREAEMTARPDLLSDLRPDSRLSDRKHNVRRFVATH